MSGMNKEIKLIPYDDCIIVEIKKISELTEGGIALTKEMIDREQMNVTDGYLVKVGDFAFYHAIEHNKQYPKVGDRVFFKLHAGRIQFEKDFSEDGDRVFKVLQDQDIYDWIDRQDEVNN